MTSCMALGRPPGYLDLCVHICVLKGSPAPYQADTQKCIGLNLTSEQKLGVSTGELGEWPGPVVPSWERVNPRRRSPAASELSSDRAGPLSCPAWGCALTGMRKRFCPCHQGRDTPAARSLPKISCLQNFRMALF